MKQQIEETLQPLVGLALWRATRAADMECFQFGAQHQTTIQLGRHRGKTALVGDYALHVQCPWRIEAGGIVLVGRQDLWYRAGSDPGLDLDEFDYEDPSGNRRDERMAALLREREGNPLVVESVTADDVGGFRIAFCDGFALAAFPADSLDGEHWRLLQPGSDGPHFVVTGRE